MNEDYQRGGEEEEEFYDDQGGGGEPGETSMYNRLRGTPRTAAQKSADKSLQLTTEQFSIGRIGAPEMFRYMTPGLSQVPSLPKVVLKEVLPEPRSDTLLTKTLDDLITEIQPTKYITDNTSYMLAKKVFMEKLNQQFLKDLLAERTKEAGNYTALDVTKVKLMRILCNISDYHTKECAKNIFDNINLLTSNNIAAPSAIDDFTTNTNIIIDHYLNQDIFFLADITTFINSNIAGLAAESSSNYFMKFIVQLLIIYFYPIFLLQTICNTIIVAFKNIEQAKNSLTNVDESITKFSELINTISTAKVQVGGGLFGLNLRKALSLPEPEPDDDAAAFDAALAAANPAANPAEQVKQATEEATTILTDYIQNYTGSNSYVSNSQKLFYKALINFAVSIGVDKNKYYIDKIHLKLQRHIRKVLNVTNDSAKVDISDYTNNLNKAVAERDKFEKNVRSTYKATYDSHKKHLKNLRELLSTTTDKARVNVDIERAEDIIRLFKLDFLNQSDPRKRQMGQLFQKELDVEAAENALKFLPNINDKKQIATGDTNIGAVLSTDKWLQGDVPFNYSEEIAKFISEGIKESTMFTFTINDNKTEELRQAAAKTRTRTIESNISGAPPSANQFEADMTNATLAEARTRVAEARTRVATARAETKEELLKSKAKLAAANAKVEAAKAAVETERAGVNGPVAVEAAEEAVVAAEAEREAARAEAVRARVEAANNTSAVNADEGTAPPPSPPAGAKAAATRSWMPSWMWATPPPTTAGGEGGGGALGAARTIGGKRRTRRYKKRAGTRRHKKRSGTHRKRKNTTR